jgi:putative transposase
MPRSARLEVPGIPLHVTHRGVNRCAVFVDDTDRATYLRLLSEQSLAQQVALHAYVLMGNHVHLLLSSSATGTISRALRNAVQAYVRAFNTRHGRTGTLWEGRFKSCLVDTDRYLLSVIRYIELNPVRAGMVADPAEYPWSSARFHLGRRLDPRLSCHPLFLALGADRLARGNAYATWLMDPIGDEELRDIRRHVHKQRALGDQRFRAMLKRTLNRDVSCREPGRPHSGVA